MPRRPTRPTPESAPTEPEVPLRHRLPNPPAVFSGRRAEVERLAGMLRRGSVAWIWGAGGLGKTALVLHALHRRFAAQVPRALFLPLPSDRAIERTVRFQVARALAESQGLPGIDWSGLPRDPEELTAAILDLAEAWPAWVVLDNLGAPKGSSELVRALARYARQSRWIVTSRDRPSVAELGGQVLALGPMKAQDLARAARALAPGAPREAVERAVAESSGSPWRLRQLLAGQPGEGGRLAGLSHEARELLEALSFVGVPLPPATIGAFAAAGQSPGLLDDLERRGLLERSAWGYRLHDVARGALVPAQPAAAPELQARVAGALAGQEELGEAIEGLRLLAAGGEAAEMRALLDRVGDRCLAEGYAVELWSLLEGRDDDLLASFRLRCAVEVGDAEALSRARLPPSPTLRDRLAWAVALGRKADYASAAELAAEVQRGALDAGDETLAGAAALVRALYLRLTGRRPEALAIVQATRPGTSTVQRELEIAKTLAQLGRWSEALAQARAVRDRLPALSERERWRIQPDLAWIFQLLSMPREAEQLMEQVLSAEGANVLLFRSRQVLMWHADVLVERGHLDRGRRALARIEPFCEPGSLPRPFFLVRSLHRRLFAGELDGFEALLSELTAEAASRRNRELGELAALTGLVLGTLRAEPPPSAPPADSSPYMSSLFALRRREAGARAGENPPADVGAPPEQGELRIVWRVVRAAELLAAGQGDAALDEARAAIQEASRLGFGLLEAEARQLLCESLLALRRPAELHRAAEELAALAGKMPSPRFSGEARFFRWAAKEPLGSPAPLETLAAEPNVSPVAARRARALLGGEPPLDQIDQRVLAAVRGRPEWRPFEQVIASEPGAAWRPAWGLDERRGSVWLPDGREVDLARSPTLWRTLLVIADHGGAATKDDLLALAWGVRDYHPERHGHRLRSGLWQLRQMLEDRSSRPERLLTTTEGYAFGGIVRRWRAR